MMYRTWRMIGVTAAFWANRLATHSSDLVYIILYIWMCAEVITFITDFIYPHRHLIVEWLRGTPTYTITRLPPSVVSEDELSIQSPIIFSQSTPLTEEQVRILRYRNLRRIRQLLLEADEDDKNKVSD